MAHALLPDPKALALDTIAVQEGVITFYIRTTAAIAVCPDCGCCSGRVHSRYQRTLQDLPWQGNSVRFLLTVRRFFCCNADCKRKIFAEAPVSVARRYRRKTNRLDDLLLQLVWKIGGESAAAIARLVGLLLSPDAALYRFKKSAQNTLKESPEILGIDNFAFRKGHTYGTILIDLRTSTPSICYQTEKKQRSKNGSKSILVRRLLAETDLLFSRMPFGKVRRRRFTSQIASTF